MYDGLEVIFRKHKRNEAAAAAAKETGGANGQAPAGPSGSAQPGGGAGPRASVGHGGVQAGQVQAPIDVDAPTAGPSAMARPPVPTQPVPGPAPRAPMPAPFSTPVRMMMPPGQTAISTAHSQPAGTNVQAVNMPGTAPQTAIVQPVAVQHTNAVERAEPTATNKEADGDAELRRLLTSE